MGKYITANEVISGTEGEIWVNVEGSLRQAAEIKKLTATVEKTKNTFKVIGYRGEQNKSTGYKGSGSMTMYYGTSIWAKIMEQYTKTGKDTFFTMIVTNQDPSTTVGKQRVQLNNCNIDNLDVITIDADTEFLTTDVNFTFDSYDILEQFTGG